MKGRWEPFLSFGNGRNWHMERFTKIQWPVVGPHTEKRVGNGNGDVRAIDNHINYTIPLRRCPERGLITSFTVCWPISLKGKVVSMSKLWFSRISLHPVKEEELEDCTASRKPSPLWHEEKISLTSRTKQSNISDKAVLDAMKLTEKIVYTAAINRWVLDFDRDNSRSLNSIAQPYWYATDVYSSIVWSLIEY